MRDVCFLVVAVVIGLAGAWFNIPGPAVACACVVGAVVDRAS